MSSAWAASVALPLWRRLWKTISFINWEEFERWRRVAEFFIFARSLPCCPRSAKAPGPQPGASTRSRHWDARFLLCMTPYAESGPFPSAFKKKKVVQLLLYFYKSATKPYRVRKLRYWVKGGSSSKSAPRPTACGVLLSMVCQGLTRPCMDVHAQLIVVNTRAHMLMHKRVTHWPRRPAPTYVPNDISFYFACSSSPTLPEK